MDYNSYEYTIMSGTLRFSGQPLGANVPNREPQAVLAKKTSLILQVHNLIVLTYCSSFVLMSNCYYLLGVINQCIKRIEEFSYRYM